MVKKLKEIEITDKIMDNIKPLRGNIFKEFMKLGQKNDPEDEGSEAIFGVFVTESLKSAGVKDIVDPYEQMSLNDFARVLGKVMEINNMDELFQAIGKLTRFTPKSE